MEIALNNAEKKSISNSQSILLFEVVQNLSILDKLGSTMQEQSENIVTIRKEVELFIEKITRK